MHSKQATVEKPQPILQDTYESCSLETLSSTIRSITPTQIEEIEPIWRKLTESGPFAEPFFQPEWFTAFAQTLEPSREITLATVHQKARLRAVAPFIKTNRFFGGIPARSLRSLSGIHSCRFDLAHDGSDTRELSATMWRSLAKQRDWDVIEALDVPEDGAFTQILAHARADGYLVGTWPTRKSPYLILPPKGLDPFANCPKSFKSFRNRLRSKHKKLAKEGLLSLKVYTGEGEAPLRSFFYLESSGWKAKRGSAIASQLPLIRFYSRIVAECAQRGRLRIYALTLDSKPVAMHLGLLMNGTYYAPKVAYDEDFARFSPGQILVHNVITDLVAQGVRRYDFLGPRSLWKSVWTDQVREHHNCYIFRPTLKGSALYALTMQIGGICRRIRYKLKGDPQEILVG